MKIEKECAICGRIFYVPHWRTNAKYCSKLCSGLNLRAKPNTVCTQCGKEFHMKQSQKNKHNRNHGYFCSKDCSSKYKQVAMSGAGNHQYGLKGPKNGSFKGSEITHRNHNITDILVYKPNHPYADKKGRVTKHRLVVEENRHLFSDDFFILIDGFYVLKKGLCVHHKDGNHNNNDISNFEVLSRGSHTKKHNAEKIIIRNGKGQIIAVIKREELLGNLAEGNQQPSQPLTKLEGSETNG
ncbi:MAG: hypothetical protein IKY94_11665 [Lachnospiraceae bacterium]|nr:hypothetical protein [Lachnospiraceae bacterium]